MQCIKPIIIKKNLDPKQYPDGLEVPCGKCIACRIKKRSEWSLRMLHELGYWKESVFLTLTYTDQYIPLNASLVKKDLQLFIKRLRKNLDSQDRKIKYFACGEYGDQTERPHYHIIIYGLGLTHDDKLLVMRCWPYADWSIPSIRQRAFGLVEPDSIRYVAQYIDKKFTGDLAEQEYTERGREPVFRILSQGIGKQFALDNAQQLTDNLYVTQFGRKMSLPRYYLKLLDIDTELLHIFAQDNNCKVVEHHTGIETDFDTLYKHASLTDVKCFVDGVNSSRRQYEKNLTGRINLKKKKL